MNFKYISNTIASAAVFALLALGTCSCTGDLDKEPISPKIDTKVNADGLFNKCYAIFAMAGNGDGDSGDANSDVKGYDDEGMTNFVRMMWNANELTTDEAICSWGDNGISQLNINTYDNANQMMKGYFARLALGISNCNLYVEQCSDVDATRTAEIRFLRALLYSYFTDAFGNIPFSLTIGTKPAQATRAEVYDWIVKELLEIEPALSDAKAKTSADAGYGRIDKAACWLLLSRMYLNAKVYTGKEEWENARIYADKVITSSYQLNTVSKDNGEDHWSAYQMLFMGDNGETNAAKEAIFPIIQNSENIRSYGNILFLIASTFKDDMHALKSNPNAVNGCVSAAWSGNRARADLLRKFFPTGNVPAVANYEMPFLANDDRAIFWGIDRKLDAIAPTAFTNGYSVCKFVNFKTDGSTPYNPSFSDADFFLMRVAEAYLNYAEADARLNGGFVNNDGKKKLDDLRARSSASAKSEYSLDDICDEWSREFYFEGLRRPTLIRFGKFGGNNDYNWQWKGNKFEGQNFSADKNVFAIPVNELNANANLKQNPGY